MNARSLPVVIIGAGPVGLAAAAHVHARGLEPLILESGDTVGAGILRWAHVRMFSPWEYNIDPAASALLARHGWQAPSLATFPTGGEVVDRYLRPLAATPELAPHIRLGSRVTGISKKGHDRMKTGERNHAPFLIRIQAATQESEILAQAVIDASGTIGLPSPLGGSGLPALGEAAQSGHVAYRIPDVLGIDRARYSGRRVLVVGSGHSAFNVLTDLALLASEDVGTQILWAFRRGSVQQLVGGGANDQLAERGRLGLKIQRLVAASVLEIAPNFHLDQLELTADGIVARSGALSLSPVDEIVAATGYRPDLSILSELRLSLDPGTESPAALAPLIDPNLHSCGTVRPHGAEELQHPDANFFVVGMKSYGRAPTFLLRTGYEQVRSVVSAIAGDWEAARRGELVLPETGVCSTTPPVEEASATGCCGGAAPAGVDACCVKDADAKAAGESGCGCGSVPAPAITPPVSIGTRCC